MLLDALRHLLRTHPEPPPEPEADGPAILDTNPAQTQPRAHLLWPASRLALTNRLWGPGYIFPGGETETLRLIRPLGVSAAASLLIVGVGAGGPAVCAVRNLGAWVTGLEADPSLLAAAKGLVSRANVGRKVTIAPWNPDEPAIEPHSHHHCLALSPLRAGRPEPILDAVVGALKPSGQIVMTELVAAAPLNPNEPTVRRWAELQHRDPATVPLAVAVTRMLGRFRLDVRVAEDVSSRHVEHALAGWRLVMREISQNKPTRREAQQLVAEAELWLLQRRLIREGKLLRMRWHAISGSRL